MNNETTARDFLVNIIGFDSLEVDALEAIGYSPEIIAEVATQAFDNKDLNLSTEEVRKIIRTQFPEAFDFEIKVPECGTEIGEFVPHFLWKPYVPLNDYSLIMAQSGTGKTFISSWLMAQVSRGGFITGDTDLISQEEAKRTGVYPKGENVLYISSEEDKELLKDRFIKSGGDPSKFFALDRDASSGMNFSDGYLQFLLSVKRFNPKLVVIDPIQAFLGEKIDMNRMNQLRPALARLASIAKKCNCAIVLISHVNKGRHSENINNAANGSADIVNAARSAMMLIQDPDDKDSRILVHTKANYAALGTSLKYHITIAGGLVYDGISTIDKDMLEKAAELKKSVGEVLANRDAFSEVEDQLVEAVCSYAVAGKSVIVTYEQFKAENGDEIFGSTGRPSTVLKLIKNKLKARGVTLEFKTANDNPVKAFYQGKNRNGFEIYMDKNKGQA